MVKKGAVKKREPAPEMREPEPLVCQFCGGRGYIELDKVGLVITPCYNCLKGITKAREIGVPEEVIRIRTGANKPEAVSVGGGIPEGIDVPEAVTTTNAEEGEMQPYVGSD